MPKVYRTRRTNAYVKRLFDKEPIVTKDGERYSVHALHVEMERGRGDQWSIASFKASAAKQARNRKGFRTAYYWLEDFDVDDTIRRNLDEMVDLVTKDSHNR